VVEGSLQQLGAAFSPYRSIEAAVTGLSNMSALAGKNLQQL
jgi:hypothetical protein